jgi:hypothetical protein
MEDMDLVISPTKRQITVDPESPNMPSAIVMQWCSLSRSAADARP